MKNTELRIGNYVEIYGKVEKVVDVLCDSVNTLNIEGVHYGLVNPIPLTKDWLEKLGFDRGRKNKFWIILEKQMEYKFGRVYYNSWTISEKQPDFVHQLQNLYFAITGEELTTKN